MARLTILPMLAVLCGACLIQESSGEDGRASWYALTTRTASGEPSNPNGLTAAHRSLPFGTRVRVENIKNGRSVVVRINDRGPFARDRIIDLTRSAALQIGFLNEGTASVRLSVVVDDMLAQEDALPKFGGSNWEPYRAP